MTPERWEAGAACVCPKELSPVGGRHCGVAGSVAGYRVFQTPLLPHTPLNASRLMPACRDLGEWICLLTFGVNYSRGLCVSRARRRPLQHAANRPWPVGEAALKTWRSERRRGGWRCHSEYRRRIRASRGDRGRAAD